MLHIGKVDHCTDEVTLIALLFIVSIASSTNQSLPVRHAGTNVVEGLRVDRVEQDVVPGKIKDGLFSYLMMLL